MTDEELQKVIRAVRSIEERNQRVEADKAWETSIFRVCLLSGIIYCIAAIVFYIIKARPVLLNALIPTIGFYISTQSLPVVRKHWIARYRKQKTTTQSTWE